MLAAVRLIIIFCTINITTVISAIICIVIPFSAAKTYFIASFFSRLTAKLIGLKIEVRGLENITSANPAIIISNHQSYLDVITCTHIVPKNTVSVGKKSILFIPIYGLLYWLAGNILIDRKNTKSAIKTMNHIATIINKKHLSVWIMAEGTRNQAINLLPFKKGPFLTAMAAGVPIIPVAISNYQGTINFNRYKMGKVIVEALPPINTSYLQKSDVKELSINTKNLIENKVKLLTNELL